MSRLVVSALLLALLSPLSAIASTDEELILACRDAVKVYDSRDELALGVIIDASPAELLQAGYCRGRLEGHYPNWYSAAERIAREDVDGEFDACDLLRDSFCR